MKRKNKFMPLLTSLLTISALASCEEYTIPKAKWKDEITVIVGGKEYKYEDFFKQLENTKTDAQSLFSVASNVLAQIVTPITPVIESTVNTKMKDLDSTWKTNAKTNSTSYKEEKEKTLDSENVEDLDELRKKYIAQEQNTTNSNEYYNLNADGNDSGKEYKYYISEQATKDYVTKQAPYHVSHILVKVDAAEGGTGMWDGQISADNAKKISNVVKMISSSTSFKNAAQMLSDDDGSAKLYGELYTSGDSPMVAMEKSTSYINEFKLGLYAYEAYLNPKTKENNSLKASLRVPGSGVKSDSNFSYNDDTTVKDSVKETLIGKKAAFGIPLSKAFTLGAIYDIEQDMETKKSVDYSSATQYPRNIMFNRYFNYHGVNFIYDDREEYDASFLKEAKEIAELKGITSASSWAAPGDCKNDLPNKYQEYEDVKALLDKVDENKFGEVDGISDNLYEYVDKVNDADELTGKAELSKISGNKKILLEEECNDSSDEKKPIVVVRGGSSGSYQGIHFIVVNKDPFVDSENVYKYYRMNVPKSTAEENSPNTLSYSKNPSFINYVTADINSNTTYNERRDAVYKSIKASDSHSEFTLFKNNLQKYASTHNNEDFYTILGLGKDENGEEKPGEKIKKYIEYESSNTIRTANESLDDSWETYINLLTTEEKYAKERILPQVCISNFEGGTVTKDPAMEVLCHVKK